MKHLHNHIILHVGTYEIRSKTSANCIANDIVKVCMGLKTNDNAVCPESFTEVMLMKI